MLWSISQLLLDQAPSFSFDRNQCGDNGDHWLLTVKPTTWSLLLWNPIILITVNTLTLGPSIVLAEESGHQGLPQCISGEHHPSGRASGLRWHIHPITPTKPDFGNIFLYDLLCPLWAATFLRLLYSWTTPGSNYSSLWCLESKCQGRTRRARHLWWGSSANCKGRESSKPSDRDGLTLLKEEEEKGWAGENLRLECSPEGVSTDRPTGRPWSEVAHWRGPLLPQVTQVCHSLWGQFSAGYSAGRDGLWGNVIADCECPAAGGWTPYLLQIHFFLLFSLQNFILIFFNKFQTV